MKSLIIISLSLFFIASIAGAQSTQTKHMGGKSDYQATATSPDEIIKSLQENDRTFEKAAKNKDVDRIMSFYWKSPDLTAMYPDGNYKGFDEVRNSYAKLFSDNDVKDYSLDDTKLEVHGDVAIEYGYFTMVTVPKTQANAGVTSRGGMDDKSGKTNDQNAMGTTNTGSQTFKGQYTTIWELKDGKWVITLDHASVPSTGQMQKTNGKN